MNAKPALVRPLFASEFDPLIALWIIRLSIHFSSAINQFNDCLYSDELRQLTGIAPQQDPVSKVVLKRLLKARADELEQLPQRRKPVLMRNIEMLATLLDLDELQAQIVGFAALSRQHSCLSDQIESIRTTSIDALIKLLSIALNAREIDVRKAIRSDGQLRITRIVSIEHSDGGRGWQIVMPPGLSAAMFNTADNIEMLMNSFLEIAPSAKLKVDAFAHLARETELLAAYLSKAGASRAPGINILIYGPPGTGKTEYVRWLASHQNKRLYQVKAIDDQGNAISGLDRLVFFQLSQRFLQKSDVLMLFDEIEDVFPTSDNPFFRRRPAAGKMFINRTLENNPVPTIWISNEVRHIDKAYLRRFDFSFEMGIPPIAVRRGILNNYLQSHAISDETISYLAQQEQLSPAQIEKAAKILQLSGTKEKRREATLLQVIENSQLLLGQDKNATLLNFAECSYQLDFLNPDCDLAQLVAQLKRAPKSVGALCFYGAPGTGKTALAHYIAKEIESPLLVKRAALQRQPDQNVLVKFIHFERE